MLRQPEKIKFENQRDIVDYVSKGLPPKKSDYEKLTAAIKNPLEDASDKEAGKDLIITQNALQGVDPETFNMVLDRVYANNVKNRNIGLAVAGIFGVCLVAGLVVGGKNKKKDEDE